MWCQPWVAHEASLTGSLPSPDGSNPSPCDVTVLAQEEAIHVPYSGWEKSLKPDCRGGGKCYYLSRASPNHIPPPNQLFCKVPKLDMFGQLNTHFKLHTENSCCTIWNRKITSKKRNKPPCSFSTTNFFLLKWVFQKSQVRKGISPLAASQPQHSFWVFMSQNHGTVRCVCM